MGLGHVIYERKKEKAPDDPWVSSVDTDAYDDELTDRLTPDNEDEQDRIKALSVVRKHLPELSHLDDGKLAEYAQSVRGRKTPAPAPAAQRSEADIQKSNARKAGRAMFQANTADVRRTLKSALSTEGEKENARLAVPSNITPADVKDERVREFETQEEMEKFAAEESNKRLAQGLPGVSAVNARTGWGRFIPNVQVQDPKGNTLGQLRPGSSYDRSRVRGMPVVDMDQLTGASDWLQQGAARTIAKGIDWGANPPPGYGFKELGADQGGKLGRAHPKAAKRLVEVMAGPLSVASKGLGAVDKAEEYAARGIAAASRIPATGRGGQKIDTSETLMDRWAKDNQEESKKYMDAADSLEQMVPIQPLESPEWRKTVDLPSDPEAGAAYGKGMGSTAGEAASMVTPTSGSLIGGALGKNVVMPAAQMLRRNLAKVGNSGWLGRKGMESISPAPSALELPEGVRQIVNTAGAAHRSAGDVFERQQLESMVGKLREGTTATDDELEAALQKTLDVWHDAELRKTAAAENPLVGKMFNDLQPVHEQNHIASGLKGPYNPLHVQRGQDISKRHTWGENQAAIEAEANLDRRVAEDASAVGQTVNPAAMRGVPGISDEMIQRMYSRPEHEAKGAQAFDELRAAGDKVSSGRANDPAYGPTPGYEDVGPVGAKEYMAAEADRAVAAEKAMDLEPPPAAQVVPRTGRSRADQVDLWTRNTKDPDNLVVKELSTFNAAQALARSARNIAEGKGLSDRAMFDVIMSDMKQLKADKHVMDASEFFALRPDIKGAPRVNVNREVITQGNRARNAAPGPTDGPNPMWVERNAESGLHNLTDDAITRLKDEQKVIVTNGELKLTDNANVMAGNRPVIVHMPNLPPELEGKVVTRQVAQALQEFSSPSDWAVGQAAAARSVDKLLGATQLAEIVTRGNPGFEARNLTNNVIRLTVNDVRWSEAANLALVEEISNAPLGKGGRFIPELGMTAGEAHELAARTASMGRGVSGEMMGLKQELGMPPWAREGMPQFAEGGNRGLRAVGNATRPLKAVARGGIKLADMLSQPGKAVGEAAGAGVKKALFPGLNKVYSADDGLRMAGFVNEMRQGARPNIAAALTRDLLIDYGNMSPGQKLLRLAVPFNAYYGGAVSGLARLAMTKPRQFSRLYDVMRTAENWDTDMNGDGRALNRKFKSSKDAWAGSPLTQNPDGGMQVSRIEGLQGEVASLAEIASNARNGFTPQPSEGNLFSIAHPAITAGMESFTGKNPVTGRNVFGASEDDFNSAVANLKGQDLPVTKATLAWSLRQVQQHRESKLGWSTNPLGEHPDASMAWHIASTLPGVGRATMPAPMATAFRMYNGTTNPASRSPESTDQMARRTLDSWLLGVREQTLNKEQEQLRSQRQFGADTNAPAEVTLKKAAKGGKVDLTRKRAMQQRTQGGSP